MSPGHDKFCRQPIASEVAGAGGMVDSDGKVLVYLKMEMWWIHAVIGTDCTDLHPPFGLLPFTDKYSVKVSVQ